MTYDQSSFSATIPRFGTVKSDAEREESFPLLLSTKIPFLKSTNLCLKKKMVLVQSMAQGVIV
jgi:hypothetical protein